MSVLCIFNPTEKVMIVLMFSELCCYKPQYKDVQWFNSCIEAIEAVRKKIFTSLFILEQTEYD